MKVVLVRGGMRPRALAEVQRPDLDERATLALLVDIDVSDDEVLELLADELTPAELASAAAALQPDRPGGAG